MADINELANLMGSVDTHIKEQSIILKSILTLQEKEAARWELQKADRDVVPPPQSDDNAGDSSKPTPKDDNSLAGLLASLGAIFGAGMLSRFSVLAAGAAALATTVGVTIGIVSGQMTAISTFFRAFAPGLISMFSDFRTTLSGRFTNVITGFTELIDNFRTRVGSVNSSVTETFDNFIQSIRNMFSSGTDSRLSRVITAIRTSLNTLIEPFRTALTTIQELVGPRGAPGRISSIFSSISGFLGRFGSAVSRIASVVGRLFAPIAIITTAWETITGAIEGYAEGGILGGLQGAIEGFFTSLITVPLDLVTNLVAWVAERFGFDETAQILRDFSFTDLFRQILDSIFNGVSAAIGVITDAFSFGEEDMSLIGALGRLTDIVYIPVNMAINFVRSLFGFEETDEPFRLQDWITDQIGNIIDSIREMFSFIPSIDELKSLMFNALPQWMQDLIGGETVRGSLPQENYTNPVDEFSGLGFSDGTRGFMDFGSGTRATLHGLEAVVPRNTEAGQFLSSNFDDNWRLRMTALENNSARNAVPRQPVIINAPNNSVTTSAPSSSSTTIAIANGSRSDLDYFALPGGVS